MKDEELTFNYRMRREYFRHPKYEKFQSECYQSSRPLEFYEERFLSATEGNGTLPRMPCRCEAPGCKKFLF